MNVVQNSVNIELECTGTEYGTEGKDMDMNSETIGIAERNTAGQCGQIWDNTKT